MQARLEELEFNFEEFSEGRFVTWLEERRGYRIIFVPLSMPPTQFGAWIEDACDRVDYIFYERDTIALHQAHIKLHEMCHIICGHPTLVLGEEGQARALLRQASADPSALEPLLRSTIHSDQMEAEAETLAALIQERVVRSQGLEKLISLVSSNKEMEEYLKAMELN